MKKERAAPVRAMDIARAISASAPPSAAASRAVFWGIDQGSRVSEGEPAPGRVLLVYKPRGKGREGAPVRAMDIARAMSASAPPSAAASRLLSAPCAHARAASRGSSDRPPCSPRALTVRTLNVVTCARATPRRPRNPKTFKP